MGDGKDQTRTAQRDVPARPPRGSFEEAIWSDLLDWSFSWNLYYAEVLEGDFTKLKEGDGWEDVYDFLKATGAAPNHVPEGLRPRTIAPGGSRARLKLYSSAIQGIRTTIHFASLCYVARRVHTALDNWDALLSGILLHKEGGSRGWEKMGELPLVKGTFDAIGSLALKSFVPDADAPAQLNRLFAPMIFGGRPEEGTRPGLEHLEAIPILPKKTTASISVPPLTDFEEDGSRYKVRKPPKNAPLFPYESEVRAYLVETRTRDLTDTSPAGAAIVEPGRFELARRLGKQESRLTPGDLADHKNRWDAYAAHLEHLLVVASSIQDAALQYRIWGLADMDAPPPGTQEIVRESVRVWEQDNEPTPEWVGIVAEDCASRIQSLPQANYLLLTTILGSPPWGWRHIESRHDSPRAPRFSLRGSTPFEFPQFLDFRQSYEVVGGGNEAPQRPGAPGAVAAFLRDLKVRLYTFQEELESSPSTVLAENMLWYRDPLENLQGYQDHHTRQVGVSWVSDDAPSYMLSKVLDRMEATVVLTFTRTLRALCEELEGNQRTDPEKRKRAGDARELLTELYDLYAGQD